MFMATLNLGVETGTRHRVMAAAETLFRSASGEGRRNDAPKCTLR
jgi:hypothetical protein